MHNSVSFNFFLQFEKGWWGGAHIEIDLDRNRGLELQQAWSDDEVGWSAGAGLFGQLAKAITKVELGGAVTYEYNMSKTQADCTMLLREMMVVAFTFSLSSIYVINCLDQDPYTKVSYRYGGSTPQ